MCCLFGIVDVNNELSSRVKNKMLSILAKECEERGTDATGIAYNKFVNVNKQFSNKFTNNNANKTELVIYKKPVAGRKMKFKIAKDTTVIMGHTRFTTQGKAKYNQNNHPFRGVIKRDDVNPILERTSTYQNESTEFALAHNGVLYNDDVLRIEQNLAKTNIQTDSYVAVQLIEKEGEVSFRSLKNIAQQLEGSFVLTILDKDNNLYFVKGSNPLCIYYYPQSKIYIYASTEEILRRAIKHMHLNLGQAQKVIVEQEEILRIDSKGERSKENFVMQKDYYTLTSFNYYSSRRKSSPFQLINNDISDVNEEGEYVEDLKAIFNLYGYDEDEVDELLELGYTADELENMIYLEEQNYYPYGW